MVYYEWDAADDYEAAILLREQQVIIANSSLLRARL